MGSHLKYRAQFIRLLIGTGSFSNDTVRLTVVSTHACYNGDIGIKIIRKP